MKIAIVGPGRSGKDEAAHWFRDHTGLRYFGPTSMVITPHAAMRLGLSLDEAYARRHEDRALWRKIGDELRAHDSAHLARTTLNAGDIVVGVRARVEMEAVQSESLVDLTLWISREVPPDDTLEFGSEVADVVIENHWDLPAFHRRLERLARSWGLLPFA